MTIARYDPNEDGGMDQYILGPYVEYREHQRIVGEKDRYIAELERDLGEGCSMKGVC